MTRPKGIMLGAIAFVVALFGTAPAGAADIFENFKSEVRSIAPAVSGLQLKVLGGDQFLELQNSSRSVIVVEGYDDEPYLRFNPNGVVQRNRRSPATYLNADRRGLQPVPASAKPRKPPIWETVAKDGRFRWFDHRIHVTTKGNVPRRIRDATHRIKLFNWKVPLAVAGRPAQANGTLYWDPASSSSGGGGVSSGAVIAAVAAAVAIALSLAALLRRRARPGGESPGEDKPAEEAW